MLETTLFYLFSFIALSFAAGVVLCRSAIYSVLCLVGALGALSALFVLLKAFFVATVLILVYAGAILVLFLFVVMLLDFRNVRFTWKGPDLAAGLAATASALFLVLTFGVIGRLTVPSAGPALHGTAEAIGRLLFGRYVLPFELTAFLILAAVISVVVLAKKGAQ